MMHILDICERLLLTSLLKDLDNRREALWQFSQNLDVRGMKLIYKWCDFTQSRETIALFISRCRSCIVEAFSRIQRVVGWLS